MAEKKIDDLFIQEKIYDLNRCLPTNAEKWAAEFRLTKGRLDGHAKKSNVLQVMGGEYNNDGGSFIGSYKGSIKKGKGSEDGK